MAQGKLVLIIGPSGVGKSVILKTLRDRHPELVFPRSATTRQRRLGEGDELYHFVSEADFTQWEKEKKFLETAQVHHGARYGTLLSEIVPPIEAGKTVVREVDVQGFLSIKDTPLFQRPSGRLQLQTIFILPESIEQLMEHIRKRAPMAEEELQRRMQSVAEELKHAKDTDVQIANKEGGLQDTIRKVEEAVGH
jgi:guanylate kinase